MPSPAAGLLTARRPTLGAGVAVAVGVVVVLLAVAFSGAARPTPLLDPGALVRWGLPVATVLSELAASLTLGALVLGSFVLPRGEGRRASDGRAWPAVVRVAAAASAAWAVLGLLHLVLTYASVSGTPVDSPSFGPELGLFVGSVALGRALLAVTVAAAVVSVLALLATTPLATLLTSLVVLTAFAIQSTSGHVAGSSHHDLAISSLFLHLTGAAVWVGGLAALALVAHRLGADLSAAVRRYSVVAAWCLVAVAVSGLVNAGIRLGGWSGLSTRYGVLVIAKVVLLGALGGLGALHRRRVIPHLSGHDEGRAPWLFWRLVLVELLVMGAVTGVAVALSSSAPPARQLPGTHLTPAEIVTGHPLPLAPDTALWLTSFRWDLLPALGCLAAVVVYLRWYVRLRRRGDAWPVGRVLSLVAGMVLLAWTTSGGPAVYGHVLFSAHMVQHMLLVMVIPIFVVLSAPVTLVVRAVPARGDGSRGPREWLLALVHSRWAQLFANPVVAAVNFAGSMFVFYFTDLFQYSLTTYVGHLAMIAHFSFAGYLFINALIGVDPGPTRPGYPLRLVLLFAAMVFHAFFGLALVSDETLLVPDWFGLLGRPWGPSALADQKTGGAIAWGISELPMLAIAIALALAWTRDDERTARRQDRAADRDGDSELTEYNAMLARMAEHRDR
ncbi:MAG TPA: cytochrome c oxidase assembly protein [Actinotalea sp.]